MRPERLWVRPLIVAVATMSVLVSLLVVLGRRSHPPSQGEAQRGSPSKVGAHGDERDPRHALPATAWAVLDLDLARLAEGGTALPDALDGLDCSKIDPPARVALALSSSGAAADPDRFDFLVAATQTSSAFRECARRRMLDGGARRRAWPGGFDVLSRDGGLRLLIHDARGVLVFADAPSFETSALLDVFEGRSPNAGVHGLHAELLRELGAHAGLTLTLAPPDDWLQGVVPPEEAAHSALRFLKGAALSLRDRDVYVIVDCRSTLAQDDPQTSARERLRQTAHDTTQPPGCLQLTTFLQELRDRLLPGTHQQDDPAGGWSADPHDPARFRFRWPLPRAARAQILSNLLTAHP